MQSTKLHKFKYIEILIRQVDDVLTMLDLACHTSCNKDPNTKNFIVLL